MDPSSGQTPAPKPPPPAPPGEPTTITLSAQEYRDWVHERVAKGVMFKLGTALGLIGVGGLIALITALAGLGQRELQSQVQTHVAKDVEKNVKPLEASVKSLGDTIAGNVRDLKLEFQIFAQDTQSRVRESGAAVQQRITGEVARTLLDQAKLTEQLRERADSVIKDQGGQITGLAAAAVTSAIAKEMTPERIGAEARRAVDTAFAAAGGPAALFEAKLRPIVFDANEPITHREQALRLLTIFTSRPLQLRQDLVRVLRGASATERELRKIALQTYRVCDPKMEECGQSSEDHDALVIVLDRLQDRPGGFLPWLERESTDFLARFRPDAAAPLFRLARDGTLNEVQARVVAGAIGRIGGEDAIGALIAMTRRSDGHGHVVWESVARLNPEAPWANSAARRESLRAFLDLAPGHVSRKRAARVAALDGHVTRLIRAVQNNDRASLLRLRVEAKDFELPALDFVYRTVIDEPDGRSAATIRQTPHLLRQFVEPERLEERDREVVSAALAALLRRDDWNTIVERSITGAAARDGEARLGVDILIAAWTRRLEHERAALAERFEAHVAELASAALTMPDCLYHRGSTQAVAFALEHSASRTLPTVLRRLPVLLAGDARGSGFRGRAVIAKAVDRYERPASGSDLVTDMVASLAKDRARGMVFADILGDLALEKRRHEKWAAAVRLYDDALTLNPASGESYLGRAVSYLRMGRRPEAARDLEEALRRNADVTVNTALDFVQYGDEALARRAVMRSAERETTPKDKAGALENLGLYYIRHREFAKAFAHSTEVLNVYEDNSWNWLIRAIAARRLNRKDDEEHARRGWEATRQPSDIPTLSQYIKDELQAYLSSQ